MHLYHTCSAPTIQYIASRGSYIRSPPRDYRQTISKPYVQYQYSTIPLTRNIAYNIDKYFVITTSFFTS